MDPDTQPSTTGVATLEATPDDATCSAISTTIRWSSAWQQQAWRITALRDGRYRVTASQHDARGHLRLQTSAYAERPDAYLHLAHQWMGDASAIYDANEGRFRSAFCRWRDGCLGFRPRCHALRQRAESARDDLYAFARWAGQTWTDLGRAVGDPIRTIVVPGWLDYAVEEQPGASVPPLEHWLRN